MCAGRTRGPRADAHGVDGLDRVDEPCLGAVEDLQAGRLAGERGHSLQVRPGPLAHVQLGERPHADLDQDRARPVRPAAWVLDGEATVHEHAEHAVGGGAGDAQFVGRVRDPDARLDLEHEQQPQRVVDRRDVRLRLGDIVLHSGIIWRSCTGE